MACFGCIDSTIDKRSWSRAVVAARRLIWTALLTRLLRKIVAQEWFQPNPDIGGTITQRPGKSSLMARYWVLRSPHKCFYPDQPLTLVGVRGDFQRKALHVQISAVSCESDRVRRVGEDPAKSREFRKLERRFASLTDNEQSTVPCTFRTMTILRRDQLHPGQKAAARPCYGGHHRY